MDNEWCYLTRSGASFRGHGMDEQNKLNKPPHIYSLPGNHDKVAAITPWVKALARMTLRTAGLPGDLWMDTKTAEKEVVDAREVHLRLLQNLSQAGIEPSLFDLMLANELDRNLKKQFGIAFLAATVFFTLLSYGVIVFNGICKWGISDLAITSLIIETPIQFIGLLYIIARNLFPQSSQPATKPAARRKSKTEANKGPEPDPTH